MTTKLKAPVSKGAFSISEFGAQIATERASECKTISIAPESGPTAAETMQANDR
jgi:hypothetical protein